MSLDPFPIRRERFVRDDPDAYYDEMREREPKPPYEPDPELEEIDRKADAERAAKIIAAVECPECGAYAGEPCEGMKSGVHFGRELNAMRSGHG